MFQVEVQLPCNVPYSCTDNRGQLIPRHIETSFLVSFILLVVLYLAPPKITEIRIITISAADTYPAISPI